MKGELLKRLFRAMLLRRCFAYASEDKTAIQSMLSVVVEDERKKGHTMLAEQLEKIAHQHSHQTLRRIPYEMPALRPGEVIPTVPIGEDKLKTADAHYLTLLSSKQRFNYPFIVTITRERLRHHMILSDIVEDRFCRIEREYVARDAPKRSRYAPTGASRVTLPPKNITVRDSRLR